MISTIKSASIDCLIADLPYGKTANKWDSIIPLEKLWPEIMRVVKPSGAMVFTASQPFTSMLVMSNLRHFKYDLVWEKTSATGHLNAKKMPMRAHESILVFYRRRPVYNPQKTNGHIRKTARAERFRLGSECYGKEAGVTFYDSTERYPRSVQLFASDKQRSCLHPTQKPLALMRWLVRTFSNSGDVILDPACGSGTTCLAAKIEKRHWIGIENQRDYFDISNTRML